MKKKPKGPITDNRKESIPKEEKRSKASKAILRFVLLFIGLLILLIILFSLTADKFLSSPIEKIEIATAHSVGLVLNLFGMGARVSQKFLSLKNFSVEIIAECTGLYEIFIFLAAMLAYPASFKKKLWGVFLGIPFIFLVNILRMVVITVVSNYRPSAFEFMHLYFWQVALILILLSAWILWIEKIVKSERF
ncbi:MAG: exosortase H [candidate division Zixibacteria bacterium]|nr:exosortase H [candidate division Zixibacteria bacterium]